MSKIKIKQLNLQVKLAILFLSVAAILTACVLSYNVISQNNNNAFADGENSQSSYNYIYRSDTKGSSFGEGSREVVHPETTHPEEEGAIKYINCFDYFPENTVRIALLDNNRDSVKWFDYPKEYTYQGRSFIYDKCYYSFGEQPVDSIENATLINWAKRPDGSHDGTEDITETSKSETYLVVYVSYVEQFTVTFNGNGHNGNIKPIPGDIKVKNGLGIEEPESPEDTGFEFKGWYKDQSCTDGQEWNFNTDKVTSNKTLWAKWHAITKDVTFYANGGCWPDQTQTKVIREEAGVTWTFPEDFPTRLGYGFEGYYDAQIGGNQITSDMTVDGSVTKVYAHWNGDQLNVFFDNKGHGQHTDAKIVTYGSEYGTLPSLTETGYSFGGWYLEEDYKTEIKATTIVNIDSAHTLYAKWTVNKYNVTFDKNGGETEADPNKIEETYDDNYILPTSNPTLSEHYFAGWFTAATGGTEITEDSIFKNDGEQTLYAHWKVLTIPVKHEDIDGNEISDKNLSVVNQNGETVTEVDKTTFGYSRYIVNMTPNQTCNLRLFTDNQQEILVDVLSPYTSTDEYMFVGYKVNTPEDGEVFVETDSSADVENSFELIAVWANTTSNCGHLNLTMDEQAGELGYYDFSEGLELVPCGTDIDLPYVKANNYKLNCFYSNDSLSKEFPFGGIGFMLMYFDENSNYYNLWQGFYNVVVNDENQYKLANYTSEQLKDLVPNKEALYDLSALDSINITANMDMPISASYQSISYEGAEIQDTLCAVDCWGYIIEDKLENHFVGNIYACYTDGMWDAEGVQLSHELVLFDKYHMYDPSTPKVYPQGVIRLFTDDQNVTNEDYDFDAWVANGHGGKLIKDEIAEFSSETSFSALAHQVGTEAPTSTLTIKVDDLGAQNGAKLHTDYEGWQDTTEYTAPPCEWTDFVYTHEDGRGCLNCFDNGKYNEVDVSLVNYNESSVKFTGFTINYNDGNPPKELSNNKNYPDYLSADNVTVVANFESVPTPEPVNPDNPGESENINGTAQTGDGLFAVIAELGALAAAAVSVLAIRKRKLSK